MVTITAIAAVSRNGVIARDGEIPWDIPQDKEQYRQTIKGAPVVMGRTTYDGSGAKTEALNIVLSRSPSPETSENVEFVESVEAAIELLDRKGIDHVYNVGGGAVYKAFLSHTDRLLISHVKDHYEGDVFFPYIDSREWAVTKRTTYDEFDVVRYERGGIQIPVAEEQSG